VESLLVQLSITENKMIEQILKDTDSRMQKTISVLTHELATIRTGRANPALVEHVKVDYHGVLTPLNQIASISIPEAKMIMIQPWDRTSLRDIEKGILKSELGLNPTSDGNLIRIVIPALTEERRKELIKGVHKRLEETRVALRNIRRDSIEHLKRDEKEKTISQDQLNRATEQIQKLIDSFIDKVNKIGHDKEREIMEI
jgi:ribosome recycling factor